MRETRRSTRIAASPWLTNGRSPQRRDRGSTGQRNTARAVPAASARTEQGAKRMTGVVTRDSAQRRPIDKHRSDARDFLLIADRLFPHPADRLLCRAVPDPAHPLPPDLRLGRRGHSAGCKKRGRLSTRSPQDPRPESRPTVPWFPKTRAKHRTRRSARRQGRDPAPQCLPHGERRRQGAIPLIHQHTSDHLRHLD